MKKVISCFSLRLFAWKNSKFCERKKPRKATLCYVLFLRETQFYRVAIKKFITRRVRRRFVRRILWSLFPLFPAPPPSLPPSLFRRVPSLSVPPAIPRVTDAGLYERARATTCSLLSLPRALHKGHPTTLDDALACLAGRPMLFSSAPLLSPPDKGGAEWNPSWNFLALYKLIYLRQKEKLLWMIYIYIRAKHSEHRE